MHIKHILSITLSRSLKILQVVMVMAVILGAEMGCSSQPPQVSLEDPYANLSPVFIGAGSVFFKIRNAGGRDALVGATVAVPNTVVEFHDVQDSRMVRIGKIAVPSRDTVVLKPGGLHIMIFNMPKSVQEGSEITLTLTFERSGEKKMPVRFEK